MLLEKYRPKLLKEFIGNKQAIEEIKKLIKDKEKILISGNAGIGKSLLIRLIAKEMKYEIAEDENIKELEKSSKQTSIFYKGKIILFELDMIRDIRGVSDILKESNFPIILISSDYDKRLINLKRFLKHIKLKKPRYDEISNLLRRICKEEKIKLSENKILEIAKNCKGDIRAAIMDLDSGFQRRDINIDIFEFFEKNCHRSSVGNKCR